MKQPKFNIGDIVVLVDNEDTDRNACIYSQKGLTNPTGEVCGDDGFSILVRFNTGSRAEFGWWVDYDAIRLATPPSEEEIKEKKLKKFLHCMKRVEGRHLLNKKPTKIEKKKHGQALAYATGQSGSIDYVIYDDVEF